MDLKLGHSRPDSIKLRAMSLYENSLRAVGKKIHVFSKLVWCVPLKNQSAASLVAAFTQLLGKWAPNTLQTDKGTEFLNRPLQKLLKEHGVDHVGTHNEETKASIVERFNRTLKTRMWRYFTKNSRFDTSTSCMPLCDRTTTHSTAVSVWPH